MNRLISHRLGSGRGSRAGRHLRRHLPDGLFHRKDQFLFIIGLEQVVHRPHRDGLLCIGELVEPGQEQNGTAFVRFPDAAGHFQPGGTGHLNVQHHHLRFFPLKNFQRFPAVSGFVKGDQITQIPLQRLAQNLALDEFVLCHHQLTLHENPQPPV